MLPIKTTIYHKESTSDFFDTPPTEWKKLHESWNLGLFIKISPLSKTVPHTHIRCSINMLSERKIILEISIRKAAQPISYYSRRKTPRMQLVEKSSQIKTKQILKTSPNPVSLLKGLPFTIKDQLFWLPKNHNFPLSW